MKLFMSFLKKCDESALALVDEDVESFFHFLMDCKTNFKGSKWDDVLIKFEFEKQVKPEILKMISDQSNQVKKIID